MLLESCFSAGRGGQDREEEREGQVRGREGKDVR